MKIRLPILFISLSLACFVIRCGGGGGGGDTTGTDSATLESSFQQPTPSADEVAKLLADLKAEAEAIIPSDVREQIEADVASNTVSLNSPTKETVQYDVSTASELYRVYGAAAFLQGEATLALWNYILADENADTDGERSQDRSQIAFVLNHQGENEDARIIGLSAVALDPVNFPALINLAFTYQQLGESAQNQTHLERAVYYLTRGLALQGHNAHLHVRLAKLYIALGQPQTANITLGTAEMMTSDPELLAEIEDLLASTASSKPSFAAQTNKFLMTVKETTIADPCETLSDEIKEDIVPVEHDYQEELDLIRTDAEDAYEQRLIATFNAISGADTCNAQCFSDECHLGCGETFCGEEMANHALYAESLREYGVSYEGATLTYIANYEGAVWQAIMTCVSQEKATPADIEGALQRMYENVNKYKMAIQGTYAGVKSGIGMDFAATEFAACGTDVGGGEGDIIKEWELPLPNIDICITSLLCIGLTQDKLQIRSTISVFRIKVNSDIKTGNFSFGIGIGASDPTGKVSSGVSLYYHTEKGIGVNVDATIKIASGFGVKVGKTHYFTN